MVNPASADTSRKCTFGAAEVGRTVGLAVAGGEGFPAAGDVADAGVCPHCAGCTEAKQPSAKKKGPKVGKRSIRKMILAKERCDAGHECLLILRK